MLKGFGALIVLAGAVRIGMTPTSLVWGTDSTQELSFGFAACILMAVASLGLYLFQPESGKSGFISTLLLVMFNAVTACMVWTLLASGQTGEALMTQDPGLIVIITKVLIMLGMFIGTPLFTWATFKAKVFPRWTVWLLILSMIGPMLPGLEKWGALFWGLAYVGLGYVMLTRRESRIV